MLSRGDPRPLSCTLFPLRMFTPKVAFVLAPFLALQVVAVHVPLAHRDESSIIAALLRHPLILRADSRGLQPRQATCPPGTFLCPSGEPFHMINVLWTVEH